MVVGKRPALVCFALKTFPGACYPTKVRWPRDGIQNQIQMSQARSMLCWYLSPLATFQRVKLQREAAC